MLAGQTDENFTVCIPIPESGISFLTMIFPQDDIRDCYVPVHRSRSCRAGCIQNSAYSISCENSMACFSNLTSAKNVPVYFIRQTKCSSDSIVTCYERVAQFIIEVPGKTMASIICFEVLTTMRFLKRALNTEVLTLSVQ